MSDLAQMMVGPIAPVMLALVPAALVVVGFVGFYIRGGR